MLSFQTYPMALHLLRSLGALTSHSAYGKWDCGFPDSWDTFWDVPRDQKDIPDFCSAHGRVRDLQRCLYVCVGEQGCMHKCACMCGKATD